MEYIDLNDGHRMPIVGIGTFRLSSDEAESAVMTALKQGYRHIDTANAYMNERAIGRAIKKSDVDREGIFLTTKLFPHTYNNAAAFIEESLLRLDVSYLDLLLLHQPFGNIESAWQALEEVVKKGQVKSIGISNFTEDDINKLMTYAQIKPAVLQVECHPYHAQEKLRNICAAEQIHLEAWYPLGSGDSELLSESLLRDLA